MPVNWLRHSRVPSSGLGERTLNFERLNFEPLRMRRVGIQIPKDVFRVNLDFSTP